MYDVIVMAVCDLRPSIALRRATLIACILLVSFAIGIFYTTQVCARIVFNICSALYRNMINHITNI